MVSADEEEKRKNVQEMTDLEIYKRFINKKDPNKKYNILSSPKNYPFDVIQESEKRKSVIELKARLKYTYEQYEEIYLEKKKIKTILASSEAFGFDGAYLFVFYPKSDRVVMIDLKAIYWEKVYEGTHPSVRVGFIFANKCTASSRDEKTYKEVVYFPLKRTDGITYVYRYNNLDEEYRTLFAENMKKVSSDDEP